MNKDLKKIIKEIECYQNEDMCLIMLSQKENKALLDYITNLQQIEQEHKKINGELREKNNKLEIALQNIQEDYDKRTEENERLKELKEHYLKYRSNEENQKEVYEILELPKDSKNLHKHKNTGGLLWFDIPMTKFSCISSYIRSKDLALEDYKSRCEKAIDKLTIKQARFINEKDYILDDNDLDEIMYILQNGSDSQ